MSRSMRFQVDIDTNSFEQVNPLFTKGKAYVMYAGTNRNNSHMSKEVIERALPSIFNIPVVGEWREKVDNFGGHGGKLEITDNDIRYVDTTKPYGVVPESCNPRWELVSDRYTGEQKEYLVVDVYLWTGRYPELNKLVSDGSWQSMEIEPSDAEWVTQDIGQGFLKDVFRINAFDFSALCILAKDDNPDVDVEPCFEDAQIVAYSLNKEKFKLEFQAMLKELKGSVNNNGGDGVKFENEAQETVTEEVTEATETEVVEETAEATEEVTEVTEAQEESAVEAEAEEFANDEATEEATEETAVEAEETVEVEEAVEEEQAVEESVEATETVDYAVILAEKDATIADLTAELDKYRAKEKEHAIAEVVEKFADMLSEDEIEAVQAKSADLTPEEFEKELSFAFVQKSKQFSVNRGSNSINVTDTTVSDDANPYGSASKYFKA